MASKGRSGLRRGSAMLLAAVLMLNSSSLAWAASTGYRLVPQTRLKMTVIEWVPTEGDYQRVDALSGDLVVSATGMVNVPLLGEVPVGTFDAPQLAAELAKRLQQQIGLVSAPNTSIEVVEYPPIYVMGAVQAPGQYPFRPGMTLLQALALGGGLKGTAADSTPDRIRLSGDFQTAEIDLAGLLARIARLQAQVDGAATITFPAELTTMVDADYAKQVMAQEQVVFDSKASSLARQRASLEELRTLLEKQIEVLDQKAQDLDTNIANAERDLNTVATMVEQGNATVSRRSEAQRILGDLRNQRLDGIVALMGAQQRINEVERSLAAMSDDLRTNAASELQQAQADLSRLRSRQTTMLQLLSNNMQSAVSAEPLPPVYQLVRSEPDAEVPVLVDEATELLPGDVVKVILPQPLPGRPAVANEAAGVIDATPADAAAAL